VRQGDSAVKWKIIISIVVVVVLLVAGLSAVGIGLLVNHVARDIGHKAGVDKALADHEAELRAIPGVTMLGTHISVNEPPHIVVTVREITPQVRAAVPATLDGYRVDLEKDIPVTSPPALVGVVKKVTVATPEQTAAGLAGVILVDGDLFRGGEGMSKGSPRTLVVQVPASIQIWRPMGEGKEFVGFSDVRVGEMARATLTAVPPAGGRSATAADLEVYPRI
jgi:hypothetical protein